MDINQFFQALLKNLSSLDFVDKVDFQREVFIIKGRVLLQKNRFLQVYFNEMTDTMAFALIEGERRIWGIDFDRMRNWHLHPVDNPEDHIQSHPMNVETILSHLSAVWEILP
jgi:hypothetical protein